MNLGEILDEVCREKNLDRNKYELRHPGEFLKGKNKKTHICIHFIDDDIFESVQYGELNEQTNERSSLDHEHLLGWLSVAIFFFIFLPSSNQATQETKKPECKEKKKSTIFLHTFFYFF